MSTSLTDPYKDLPVLNRLLRQMQEDIKTLKEALSNQTAATNKQVGAIVQPNSALATAHEWLKSYDATTGNFTESQPLLTDDGDVNISSPATGELLTYDGGTSKWKNAAAPAGFTAGGDLAGTSTSQTVVGLDGKPLDTSMVSPSNGNVPTYDSVAGKWKAVAPTIGMSNPMTTLGDTIAENGTPTPVRVAGNTTTTRKFYRQTGTGTVSALPAWDTVTATDVGVGGVIGVIFNSPTNGQVLWATQADYNGTIVSWTVAAVDSSGAALTTSATIDIQKCTYSGWPTASSIVGSGTPPTLSSASKNTGSTFTGYTTTSFSSGDFFKFVLTLTSGAPAQITLTIATTRT